MTYKYRDSVSSLSLCLFSPVTLSSWQPSAMKILYLLFAVVFLVHQGAIEFSRAQNLNRRCVEQGGTCYYLRCPQFIRTVLGRCYNRGVCCGRGLF
ncbi:antimicrobial peptide THP1-like [Trachemys scripta elegans]|uniref:antimicrobial peptide THP1-like n=1 Tax=Trachemys scripta elegans TaxID=31138 RepID=UPI0015555ABF|nr:antimicrobial peptide THP1-like [Trachemys scripta elegans]